MKQDKTPYCKTRYPAFLITLDNVKATINDTDNLTVKFNIEFRVSKKLFVKLGGENMMRGGKVTLKAFQKFLDKKLGNPNEKLNISSYNQLK